MAWYDIFTGNSVAKHGRRIQDRDAQAEDRMQSAAWLAEQSTPESLLALCKRFDLQLEHNIKDRNEKEAVVGLLVERGPEGAQAARAHTRGSPNFQHAVRTIERMEGVEAGNTVLLELLRAESVDNEFKPEKKRNLLLILAERKDARVIAGARPFLVDFDEGVRHAAVEAIAAQEGDEGRSGLESALRSQREESTRVRGRLAELFSSRRWALVDSDGWLAANMPPGYRIFEGMVVGGSR